MTEFHEIVLDGDSEVLRGFVAGYLAASGTDEPVYVAREVHVMHDSLAHQFAEWIGLCEDRTHLIVTGEVLGRIRDGIEAAGEELKLELVESRPLASAHFGFQWETHSREVADRLRANFATPPTGVRLEGYDPEERVHDEEEGRTGAYAPTHPYTARGEGRASGEVGPLIEWASRLREDEFVTLDRIKLEYAD